MELIDRAYGRLTGHDDLYFEMLDRVHQHLLPRTYIEIGVNTGRSLTLALPGTSCVGVDPDPHLQYPAPPGSWIFAETSDEFFASHDLAVLFGGVPLDLAFIDGMHLFEFALRDFMNLERNAHADGTILIHDCLPVNVVSAGRERSSYPWSGDVWRLIVLLREQRPDLEVSVVDWPPTGVGVVRGLDPGSTVLADRYDELVERYLAMPYELLDNGTMHEQLHTVRGDWASVAALLPDRSYRSGNVELLKVQRTAAAVVPAVRRAYDEPERVRERRQRQQRRRQQRRRQRRQRRQQRQQREREQFFRRRQRARLRKRFRRRARRRIRRYVQRLAPRGHPTGAA